MADPSDKQLGPGDDGGEGQGGGGGGPQLSDIVGSAVHPVTLPIPPFPYPYP